MRVLIVDGSARVRARVAERLATTEVDVAAVADVGAALAAIAASSPDAIVLDVHLDAQTGVAGLRRIRHAAPTSLIVVSTNEVDEFHRHECIRNGADVFLDKSTEFDQLVELVSHPCRRFAEQAG